MLPLLDPRARADAVLIVDLLQGIRAKALDLVAAADDLLARLDREPPAGWVPGEQGNVTFVPQRDGHERRRKRSKTE